MAVSTVVVEDDAFTRVTLAESLRSQGVDEDWLFVTATDEQSLTARVRFDVTAAC
jgi:hypothetical protein